MPTQLSMTPLQEIALNQASKDRAQKLQQAQMGLDAASNPLQQTTDQATMDRNNAMEQVSGWAPLSEAINQYQDKGGKVDLGSALSSIRGLDSQQPGQVVTDTSNPPSAPGVQGGAGDGGSNGVGVAHAPNVQNPPVGDPRAAIGGATLTQKNARMPNSMKGLGY